MFNFWLDYVINKLMHANVLFATRKHDQLARTQVAWFVDISDLFLGGSRSKKMSAIQFELI